MRIAKLEDLYLSAIAAHQEAKSLNALYAPNPNADVSLNSFASETRAYRQTTTEPYCQDRRLPAGDLRWNIAGTKGAHHYWQIDSEGFATFIDVLCGKKLWIVARPKNPKDFFALSLWNDLDFDVSAPNLDKWNVEAVVLTPTTRL